MLLWATDDRKIFIATGRGMEGAVPDAIAKRIISTIIGPEFKQQMYYRGLDRGTDEIIKYATGEYTTDGSESGEGHISIGLIIFIVIFFFIIIVIISRNRGGGGGGMRNRGGGFYPYTTYTGWGSSSGNWGSGGGSSFGGFGGGDFGGGGAGGDY